MKIKREQSVCEWAGVNPFPNEPNSKLGIALSTVGQCPINGLRLKPENGTNGWYIWCGEREIEKESDDYFSPLCVEHINEYLPEIKEYLELPPGYRFLIDGNNYEDIWFDVELVKVAE